MAPYNGGMWWVAPVLALSLGHVPSTQIPMSCLVVKHVLVVKVGRDVWKCLSCEPSEAFIDRHPSDDAGQWVAVFEVNGRVVLKVVPRVGPYVQACKVAINPGYPVIAVRGAFGLGSHWDTIFFAIRHARLIRLGHAPANNSHGPVLWHGRRDVWAFDDLDRYEFMAKPGRRPRIVLMRVGKDRRLHRWKTLGHSKHLLPTTVHTPEVEG